MIRNYLPAALSLLAFPLHAQIPGATYTPVATQPTVGETPAGASLPLDSSTNGRYLLFSSNAPNLLAGQVDPNGGYDLFLRDLVLGDTQLVSRSFFSHLRCAAGFTGPAFLSPDGRYVLFTSDASDILPPWVDTNLSFAEGHDIFEYDRTTRSNRLVSSRWDDPAQPAQFGAQLRAVSSDLRFLLTESVSADLVAGLTDLNFSQDVFLFDRSTGARKLISHSAGQPQTASNGYSEAVALSADGRYVLFRSNSTDLVPSYQNPNGRFQVFWHDTVTQVTLLVSRSTAGATTATAGDTFFADITPTGRWVLFSSNGWDLVPGQSDPNLSHDLFLFDANTGSTLLVSHLAGQPNATPGAGASSGALSADGRYVAYSSSASGLAAGAVTHGHYNAYLFDRTTGENRLLSHLPGQPLQAANGDTFVQFSGDLRNIVLGTTATNLGMMDANGGGYDLFLYDATTSTLRLVSHSLAGATVTGNGFTVTSGVLEPILDRLLFASAATDLANGHEDGNGTVDLFSFQLSTGTVTALEGLPAPVVPATASGGTQEAVVSENGRFVAFARNPSGGTWQVFLLDRHTAQSVLVSHASGQPGVPGNGDAFPLFVSDDGRFVVLETWASNLVADYVPGSGSLEHYLYDRTTAQAELLAPAAGNPSQGANGSSSFAGLSPDGRHALVASSATDLIPGFVGSGTHLFLRDRTNGTVTLVDHAAGQPLTPANGSANGTLSRDGRYVAFCSSATDLLAGLSDPNGVSGDAFLFDRLSGQIELLSPSVSVPHSTANRFTEPRALSADGRFVLLTSAASDLAAGVSDAPGTTDVFVRDRQLGTTELISHMGGAPFTAAGLSSGFALSDDARFVLFHSSSAQLVPTTAPNSTNVYLYDRAAHLATRISGSAYDPVSGGLWPATALAFSSSGRYTLYTSQDSRFVAGFVDRNGNEDDLFLYDHGTGRSVLVSHPPFAPDLRPGERGVSPYAATMSRNGNLITFFSRARDFLLNDTNGQPDIVVVSTEIFVDGFEGGSTSRWSAVSP